MAKGAYGDGRGYSVWTVTFAGVGDHKELRTRQQILIWHRRNKKKFLARYGYVLNGDYHQNHPRSYYMQMTHRRLSLREAVGIAKMLRESFFKVPIDNIYSAMREKFFITYL
jgi:hypothetical protein